MIKENSLRKGGWVIVILNIIMMFCSSNYYLRIVKFPVTAWFFFNICFFSVLIFLVGFFLKNKMIMSASIPFLTYFGTVGMFVFSWQGMMIIAQIAHIFMTLAIIYIILESIRGKEWKRPIGGFLVGLIIFLLFLPIHQRYIKNHPEYLEQETLGDQKK